MEEIRYYMDEESLLIGENILEFDTDCAPFAWAEGWFTRDTIEGLASLNAAAIMDTLNRCGLNVSAVETDLPGIAIHCNI